MPAPVDPTTKFEFGDVIVNAPDCVFNDVTSDDGGTVNCILPAPVDPTTKFEFGDVILNAPDCVFSVETPDDAGGYAVPLIVVNCILFTFVIFLVLAFKSDVIGFVTLPPTN